VLWLETAARLSGTLIVISPTGNFSTACDADCHIEQQRLRLYARLFGFRAQRAERLASSRPPTRQQREIATCAPSWTASAPRPQGRQPEPLEGLDRIEVVAAVQVDSPFHFEFAARNGRRIRPGAGAVRAGYGSQVVLDGLKLALRPGSRLACWPHGAGVHPHEVLAGTCAAFRRAREGGACHRLLRPAVGTAASRGKPLWTSPARPQRARTGAARLPGGFNFHGEWRLRPAAVFRGEKRGLAWPDRVGKPTCCCWKTHNHLDWNARALTLALNDTRARCAGVHDRHLLRHGGRLWLVPTAARSLRRRPGRLPRLAGAATL